MRFSIADIIAARAFGTPGAIAIECLDGSPSLTYAEVWCRVVAIAEVARSVESGRHRRMVGLLLPNSADAPLAFAACQWAGVVENDRGGLGLARGRRAHI